MLNGRTVTYKLKDNVKFIFVTNNKFKVTSLDTRIHLNLCNAICTKTQVDAYSICT